MEIEKLMAKCNDDISGLKNELDDMVQIMLDVEKISGMWEKK